MSDEPSWWLQLGINAPDMLAGFAGGVVNAFVFKQSNAVAIVGSIIVGAFTANYLGATFSHYLGTSQGTSAFIVGVAGMAICQGIAQAASSWRPFPASGPTNKG